MSNPDKLWSKDLVPLFVIFGICLTAFVLFFVWIIPSDINDLEKINCERLLDKNLIDRNPYYDKFTPEQAVKVCNDMKDAQITNLKNMPLLTLIICIGLGLLVFFTVVYEPKKKEPKV